jgi:hypothetical protein
MACRTPNALGSYEAIRAIRGMIMSCILTFMSRGDTFWSIELHDLDAIWSAVGVTDMPIYDLYLTT